MNTFDVVIIGGGPAGCATALSLHKNAPSTSCLVIDDADPLNFKIGESLPPESGRLLHYLHPSIPSQISNRVKLGIYTLCAGNASAWSSPVLEERHAIMNPFGQGHHLNRADFDEILRTTVLKCAAESQSSLSLEKATFKGIRKNAEGLWDVRTEVRGEGRTVLAKWVVDATGRKASVATKLGAKIISADPLLAFYAVFVAPSDSEDIPNADNDTRTLIEATPDGWWYTSLISHHPSTRIVVFHTLPSHPSAKSARRSEGFLDLLHSTSPHISGITEKWEYSLVPRKGYPRCTAAGSSHLDKPCSASDNWVAVGDAALAFDPLSSQGIMTSLEMGAYVGLQLSQHRENESTDADFDERVQGIYAQVLGEYEKHRVYYYSVVKRFPGEAFWDNVVST